MVCYVLRPGPPSTPLVSGKAGVSQRFAWVVWVASSLIAQRGPAVKTLPARAGRCSRSPLGRKPSVSWWQNPGARSPALRGPPPLNCVEADGCHVRAAPKSKPKSVERKIASAVPPAPTFDQVRPRTFRRKQLNAFVRRFAYELNQLNPCGCVRLKRPFISDAFRHRTCHFYQARRPVISDRFPVHRQAAQTSRRLPHRIASADF